MDIIKSFSPNCLIHFNQSFKPISTTLNIVTKLFHLSFLLLSFVPFISYIFLISVSFKVFFSPAIIFCRFLYSYFSSFPHHLSFSYSFPKSVNIPSFFSFFPLQPSLIVTFYLRSRHFPTFGHEERVQLNFLMQMIQMINLLRQPRYDGVNIREKN